jgi:hypothetical protein
MSLRDEIPSEALPGPGLALVGFWFWGRGLLELRYSCGPEPVLSCRVASQGSPSRGDRLGQQFAIDAIIDGRCRRGKLNLWLIGCCGQPVSVATGHQYTGPRYGSV